MKTLLPSINPKQETEKIKKFTQDVLKKQGFEKVIIAVSGGIDSATSLYLLSKSVDTKNIITVYLPYFDNSIDIQSILENTNISQENRLTISIKNPIDACKNELGIKNYESKFEIENLKLKIRLGNIMARVRMIIVYDLAKKHKALVCGTENKSENLLGYFTRFGDQASDFEPIEHLYKTQVFKLARYLGVPKEVVEQKPTADLWQGQTDEKEFGFTYQEADQVLYLYFEKKQSVEEIIKLRFPNAKKIIDFALKNSYKHHVPYRL